MSEPNHKFYLTTPIYYVNARPHIGHAYTTIAADVIARRHRLLGDDTFFLTGTDEHGQKIQRSAEAAGIPPQQFADEVSDSFRSLWKRMGITNDDYIRTTEPRHKAGVQKLFRTLQQNGYIELRSYTGQYCISDETFVDVPVGAPCPECGRITETVTEENYFFKLSAFQRQLIDLIESGELAIQPETRRNEVLSFLRGNIGSINVTLPRISVSGSAINATSSRESAPSKAVILSEAPERAAGESNGAESKDPVDAGGSQTVQPISATYIAHSTKGNPYVPGALKDLSISRTSFKWGIPVPGDEKHVIYVWLDALANYMTAIGYGSDKQEHQKKFEKYWPADLHLVGKEIIRFHCVYWPAFLLAAKLPLPKAITAHGWLLFENDKMSKSKGNIVRTETILDAFGTLQPEASKHEQDLFAADVLRYFLLREIPFGNDGSFSFDAVVQRYNSDLANGYGNLVSRTLNLIYQNQEGAVIKTEQPWLCESKKSFPKIGKIEAQKDDFQEDDFKDDFSDTETIIGKIRQLIDGSKNINDSRLGNLTSVISLRIRFVDAYLTANAPWKLAKSSEPSDRQRMDEVLYTAAESIRIITALLHPILPYATSKVWAQLGLGDIEQAARKGELKDLQWGGLKPGTKLGPLGPIFPRAPKELIQLMNDIESANAPKPNGSNGSKSVVALPQVNSDLDASARHRTEFAEMPIASASATPALNKAAETVHPIASHHSAEPAKPETPQIAIDDFVKVDLRVAQIVVAERIPKADKLLRLEVDLGYERRQILSGIAQWYTPEELIGRRIVVIANLAPRKMRGLESHGMLLAASKGEDDKPVLATFGEEIALGSRLK